MQEGLNTYATEYVDIDEITALFVETVDHVIRVKTRDTVFYSFMTQKNGLTMGQAR